MATFGAKRDYPKIDIFIRRGGEWRYVATTTWSRTLRDAKAVFLDRNPDFTPSTVKLAFKEPRKRKVANPGKATRARKRTGPFASKGKAKPSTTGRFEYGTKRRGDTRADRVATKGTALREAASMARAANRSGGSYPGDWIVVLDGLHTIRRYVANKQGRFVLKDNADKDRSTAASNEGHRRAVARKSTRASRALRKGDKRAAKKPRASHTLTSRRRRSAYD